MVQLVAICMGPGRVVEPSPPVVPEGPMRVTRDLLDPHSLVVMRIRFIAKAVAAAVISVVAAVATMALVPADPVTGREPVVQP